MPSYRWNTSDFAAGYDAAAEHIHPRYREIQDEILRLLPPDRDRKLLIVDLGGGSGRLLERVLNHLPRAEAIIFDQSEPFLALAERRLEKFGTRARCVLMRLQDDWTSQLPRPADAVLSMSAIHHLEPTEKAALYTRCSQALAPGGLLLNGDEVRPEDESEYHAGLTTWADHMRREMSGGRIPTAFHDALQGWIDRNVTRFGQPKKSGDDCHETIGVQLGYYRAAGFTTTDTPWHHDLWAILRGVKPTE
jgi:tRNA (cmo5U34)-methyltransferase